MVRINNFSVTKEMRLLEDFQSRLVLVCNILDNNPLYKGRFDDLYVKLSSVVGSIEEALSVFEHE